MDIFIPSIEYLIHPHVFLDETKFSTSRGNANSLSSSSRKRKFSDKKRQGVSQLVEETCLPTKIFLLIEFSSHEFNESKISSTNIILSLSLSLFLSL